MTKQMTKAEALHLLLQVAQAVEQTIKEAGTNGAPGGPIYAAFMARGMSYNTFNEIMAGLVDAKRLRKVGELYYHTDTR